MKKIILLILILGALLALVGFWYWQRNPYSKEVLKLEILGPERAVAGQEVTYTVKYKNNGNVRLEEPYLTFEFPEHTLLPQGETRRKEVDIGESGDIYPGQEQTFQFTGQLFGKEDETKVAKAWLRYRPRNLNASYESTTTLTTVIESIPLTLDFDLPSKVEAGRDFKFSLNYYSSLPSPLINLGIAIEYPSGFEFLGSTPQTVGNTEWEIPLLNKAEGGRIEIRARLSGEVQEQKIFSATLGVWHDDEFIVLKEVIRGVELSKPQLFVTQQINSQWIYIANPGEVLHYEISFRNIGTEPFLNLFLVAQLEGAAFDFESVNSDFGQWSRGDNAIIWDWRDIPRLRFLGQGEEGKVEFWISLKEEWERKSTPEKTSLLKNSVLIAQTKEEFATKINSKVELTQRGFFQDEVFGNSGPLPPKVGKETSYTIMWQVKNYYNDLKNVKVRARLPQHVRLIGNIFPEAESSRFTFDTLSREIVWTVRDNKILSGGAGVQTPAPNIAFQVALTPTSSDEGNTMQLIGEARMSGEDQWTEEIIGTKASAIDTTLPDDSTVGEGQGVVVSAE